MNDRQPNSACADARELLAERVDRSLDADEEQRVQAHLDGCEECRAVASWIDEVDAVAARSPEPATPSPQYFQQLAAKVVADVAPEARAPRPWWRHLAAFGGVPSLAALTALALMIGVLSQRQLRDQGTEIFDRMEESEPDIAVQAVPPSAPVTTSERADREQAKALGDALVKTDGKELDRVAEKRVAEPNVYRQLGASPQAEKAPVELRGEIDSDAFADARRQDAPAETPADLPPVALAGRSSEDVALRLLQSQKQEGGFARPSSAEPQLQIELEEGLASGAGNDFEAKLSSPLSDASVSLDEESAQTLDPTDDDELRALLGRLGSKKPARDEQETVARILEIMDGNEFDSQRAAAGSRANEVSRARSLAFSNLATGDAAPSGPMLEGATSLEDSVLIYLRWSLDRIEDEDLKRSVREYLERNPRE